VTRCVGSETGPAYQTASLVDAAATGPRRRRGFNYRPDLRHRKRRRRYRIRLSDDWIRQTGDDTAESEGVANTG